MTLLDSFRNKVSHYALWATTALGIGACNTSETNTTQVNPEIHRVDLEGKLGSDRLNRFGSISVIAENGDYSDLEKYSFIWKDVDKNSVYEVTASEGERLDIDQLIQQAGNKRFLAIKQPNDATPDIIHMDNLRTMRDATELMAVELGFKQKIPLEIIVSNAIDENASHTTGKDFRDFKLSITTAQLVKNMKTVCNVLGHELGHAYQNFLVNHTVTYTKDMEHNHAMEMKSDSIALLLTGFFETAIKDWESTLRGNYILFGIEDHDFDTHPANIKRIELPMRMITRDSGHIINNDAAAREKFLEFLDKRTQEFQDKKNEGTNFYNYDFRKEYLRIESEEQVKQYRMDKSQGSIDLPKEKWKGLADEAVNGMHSLSLDEVRTMVGVPSIQTSHSNAMQPRINTGNPAGPKRF